MSKKDRGKRKERKLTYRESMDAHYKRITGHIVGAAYHEKVYEEMKKRKRFLSPDEKKDLYRRAEKEYE